MIFTIDDYHRDKDSIKMFIIIKVQSVTFTLK